MGSTTQVDPLIIHGPKEGQLHGPSTEPINSMKGPGRMTKLSPAESNPWKAIKRPRPRDIWDMSQTRSGPRSGHTYVLERG
jgi:hypothetical protein